MALPDPFVTQGRIALPAAEQLVFLTATSADKISSLERLRVLTELEYLCLLTQAVTLALPPAPAP